LASSTNLYKFLSESPIITERINETEEEDGFPVIESIWGIIFQLNKLFESPTSFYPQSLITSLRSKMRITIYEQQDAQEFFQILSTAINEEESILTQASRNSSILDLDIIAELMNDKATDNLEDGKATKINYSLSMSNMLTRKNPLDGLLASRLSCVQCGYTEAIRHFAFNNISLSLPFRHACTLEYCLASYITIESLNDVICRKCSLKATLANLEQLQAQQTKAKTAAKKSKAKSNSQYTPMIKTVQSKLQYDIEGELGPEIPFQKVHSRHCTKQVMFAKPPPTLCLHINRSTFYPNGEIAKNGCIVEFSEYLDLSPFCTTGYLALSPQQPMSGTEQISSEGNYIYRLQSVIVHYGTHSYGHFVTFRRLPQDEEQTNQVVKLQVKNQSLEYDSNCFNSSPSQWCCVSDNVVTESDLTSVLTSNPFMLIYEQIPVSSLRVLEAPKPKVTASMEESTQNPTLSSKKLDHLEVDSTPSPSTSSSSPSTPTSSVAPELNFNTASDLSNID
jgi:ubiquitin carboxyl-terminal hydrolase 1